MAKCGCKPGTELNGWHEIRCAACVAKDKQSFAKILEACKRSIKK